MINVLEKAKNPTYRDTCSLRNSYDYNEFMKYGKVPSTSSLTLEEILDIPDPVAIRNSAMQNCVSALEVDHFLHHKHFFFRLVAVILWLDITDLKTYIVRAESDAYSVQESFRWVVRGDCVDKDEYLETRDVSGPAGCVGRGQKPDCIWKERINPFEWKCERCPYGADCRNKPAWFNVKGLFGFWRNKNFTGMTRFHRCPVPQGCLGANNPLFEDLFIMNGTVAEGNEVNMAEVNWEERCHSEMGYEGTACAICKKGVFYMTASGCKTCEGKSGGSIAVTIAVLLGGMALVGYFVYKFRSLAVIAKDVQKVSKLLINFLQVMTSIKAVYTLEIPSMNIGFSMTAYFEVFSFDFVAIFGFPCLYEMTYFEKYVADMVMLFGFGLFVLVVYILGLIYLKTKSKKKKGVDEKTKERLNQMMAMGGGKGMLSVFKAKTGPGGKVTGLNRWANVRKGFRAVSMFRSQKMTKKVALQATCIAIAAQWFMFQHQPTSVKSFNMVKCEWVDGILMLRQDYRRSCEEEIYLPYLYFTLTVICGYIVGLPGLIVWYLTKKKRILADPLVRSKVGFLYINYRPTSFLWEVQILAHKCFLTGALVCLYQYAIVQCTLAFIIAIMSHSMHASYSPFRISLLNKIQHCCLFATAVAFVGNLAFQCAVNNKDADDKTEEIIIRAMLLYSFAGAIFLAMCGGLISVSRSLKKYNKIMKEQEIKRKKAREQKRKRQLAEQGKQGKAHKKVFVKEKGDKKGQAMRGGMRRVTPRRKLNEVFHSDVHALRAFHIGHKTGPAKPNLGEKVKPGEKKKKEVEVPRESFSI